MSFKVDVLGNIKFGNELHDILRLKGVEDINSFLNPSIKNCESPLLFDNIKKGLEVFIMRIQSGAVVSIVVD